MLIWILQMGLALFFCVQKQGFHEDEFYTYYSTARTAGFYVEDQTYMDADTIRAEFVVQQGEQFQYGLVKQVQSWDVHPPLYYWIFHTVASLVPGVFSKWIGLGVNLVFHGINLLLLARLSALVHERRSLQTLVLTGFYWMTPAALSGVVFIRMYELLTTWILLCAVLHVQEMKRLVTKAQDGIAEKLSVHRFLLPMAAVTYLGFLTQYYYAVFLCFLGLSFAGWLLWRERRLRNFLYYGGSQAAAFLAAYVTYPSCLGQMFRGQRGAQATENFLDLSNTWERLAYFYDLMNVYVFGGDLLLLWLLLAAFAVCAVIRRRKLHCRAEWMVLFLAASGFFVTVAKTGLLYEGTSVRYQLPVYGIVTLLLLTLLQELAGERLERQILCVLLAGIAVMNAWGLIQGRVEFLYPEAEKQLQFVRQQAADGAGAVYLYTQGGEWCIWGVADELMQYDEVYFAAADQAGAIEDEKLRGRESLVVYVAEGADAEEQLQRLSAGDDGSRSCELIAEEKYCSVYLLD